MVSRFATAALLLVLLPLGAQATPITYTLSVATISGQLGAAKFTNAQVTFVGLSDTDTFQEHYHVLYPGGHFGPSYYDYANDPFTSLTVYVAGLPSATFTGATQLYSSGGSVEFISVSNFDLGANAPAPFGFADLMTNFSFVGSFGSQSPFITSPTTAGGFSEVYMASPQLSNFTFSAVLGAPVSVPEPASAALLLVGAGAIGWLLRRPA